MEVESVVCSCSSAELVGDEGSPTCADSEDLLVSASGGEPYNQNEAARGQERKACVMSDAMSQGDDAAIAPRCRCHMAAIATVARELLSVGETLPWGAVLPVISDVLGARRVCVVLAYSAEPAGTRLELVAKCPESEDRAGDGGTVVGDGWLKTLSCGDVIHCAAGDVPAGERTLLTVQETGTLLVVPMLASGVFAGFVAAEHSHHPSPWTELETDFLKAATSLVSEAISAASDNRSARDHGELMRALLGASPDSYYLLDRTGVILASNENGARRFGLTVGDLIGREMSTLMPPHVEELRRPHFEKVVRTGRPVRFVDQREQLHLDNAMYPVMDSQGRVNRVVVSSHNVTDIKHAERAVIESEYRYSALFEQAPVNLIVRDAGDRIVDANPAALTALGFSRDGLVGGSPLKYERATEGELAARTRRVLEGAVLDYESVYVCSGGRTFHTRVQETRIPLPDGSTGVLAISHDITRRKLDEEIVRRSELKYRGFFEAAQDAMFVVDHGTLSIIESNDAARRLYGYSDEELLGMSFDQLSGDPAGTRTSLSVRVPNLPMGDQKRKDGTLFPAEIGFSYYSQNGRELCSAVVRDQTDKVKSFEELAKLTFRLQQAQKLRSLNVMAGGIAHDFNNILHVVIGYTELAMAQMDDSSTPRTYVERSNRAARQAAELSSLMLAYVGQGKMEYKSVDLNSLVDGLKPMLSALLSKLAIVDYDLESQLPDIIADPNQLKQVVIGLTTNASESLEGEAGVVTIATRLASCDREYLSETYLDERLPEGDYVCLEVKDTGAGMDQETLGRIFDPFFTTKFAGRGLGLAAVLGIVRGHRGAIRVRSIPGEGSSFVVVLPLVQPMHVTIPEPNGRPPDRGLREE